MSDISLHVAPTPPELSKRLSIILSVLLSYDRPYWDLYALKLTRTDSAPWDDGSGPGPGGGVVHVYRRSGVRAGGYEPLINIDERTGKLSVPACGPASIDLKIALQARKDIELFAAYPGVVYETMVIREGVETVDARLYALLDGIGDALNTSTTFIDFVGPFKSREASSAYSLGCMVLKGRRRRKYG